MATTTENQFMVDLGGVKLTEAQRASINGAIQRAVASELASVGAAAGKVALIPANKLKIGPIINGLIARPINDKIFQQILG